MVTTAPCLVSTVTADSKSVTQVSVVLFAVDVLLLFVVASAVHGLHPGQQQRQVDAQARHVLVRVVPGRVEALGLGKEVVSDIQVQQAILNERRERRSLLLLQNEVFYGFVSIKLTLHMMKNAKIKQKNTKQTRNNAKINVLI